MHLGVLIKYFKKESQQLLGTICVVRKNLNQLAMVTLRLIALMSLLQVFALVKRLDQ